ncbi:beta-carotene 15,15'-monooxygenase [Mobiluncus curtisii]|uniref:beta-carotene 15,15'-monooxygenase n=1 Tax=Mobiluncus curtisii TaxID=2051 RepID=UPI00146FF1BA
MSTPSSPAGFQANGPSSHAAAHSSQTQPVQQQTPNPPQLDPDLPPPPLASDAVFSPPSAPAPGAAPQPMPGYPQPPMNSPSAPTMPQTPQAPQPTQPVPPVSPTPTYATPGQVPPGQPVPGYVPQPGANVYGTTPGYPAAPPVTPKTPSQVPQAFVDSLVNPFKGETVKTILDNSHIKEWWFASAGAFSIVYGIYGAFFAGAAAINGTFSALLIALINLLLNLVLGGGVTFGLISLRSVLLMAESKFHKTPITFTQAANIVGTGLVLPTVIMIPTIIITAFMNGFLTSPFFTLFNFMWYIVIPAAFLMLEINCTIAMKLLNPDSTRWNISIQIASVAAILLAISIVNSLVNNYVPSIASLIDYVTPY